MYPNKVSRASEEIMTSHHRTYTIWQLAPSFVLNWQMKWFFFPGIPSLHNLMAWKWSLMVVLETLLSFEFASPTLIFGDFFAFLPSSSLYVGPKWTWVFVTVSVDYYCSNNENRHFQLRSFFFPITFPWFEWLFCYFLVCVFSYIAHVGKWLKRFCHCVTSYLYPSWTESVFFLLLLAHHISDVGPSH